MRAFLGSVLARRLRPRDGARRHRALDHLRRARRRLGVQDRHADGRDVRRRDERLGARARLLDRLHARGRQPAALLRLPVGLHLRHAHAGDVRQPGADVLRLGGRRPLLLPADRLLVHQALGERGGDQGLRRQPRRRLRLCAGHLRPLRRLPHHQPRAAVRRRPGGCRPELRLPRLSGRHPDDAVPAAVHGRDGQVGAVPAAHLASRRHGGPDAGLGADPRRDHGHRRRVHGGAAVADLRARARRAAVRRPRRLDHRLLRGDGRPRPERHQARHRLFDLLAARLHVRRLRRRRLSGRHLPPLHARLLQGAAVPRCRLGDPRHAPRAGHAQDGRPQAQAAVHMGDDAHRHAGADRLRHPARRRASPASIPRTPSSRPRSPRMPPAITPSGPSSSPRS